MGISAAQACMLMGRRCRDEVDNIIGDPCPLLGDFHGHRDVPPPLYVKAMTMAGKISLKCWMGLTLAMNLRMGVEDNEDRHRTYW